MFLTWTFLFAAIAYLSFYLSCRYVRFRWEAEQLAPGPPVASLLLGNLDRFMRQRGMSKREHLQHYYQSWAALFATYRKDGVMRLWLGPFKVVYCLTKADYVQKLLNSQVHVSQSVVYKHFFAWLGDGLFNSNAETWRPRRKSLSHAFHRPVLHHATVPIFHRHTAILLQTLDCQAEKSKVKGATCVEIDSLLGLFRILALEIIKETSMGPDSKPGSEASSLAYRKATDGALLGATKRMKASLFVFDCLLSLSRKGRALARDIATLHRTARRMILQRLNTLIYSQSNQDRRLSETPSQGAILLDHLLLKAVHCPGEMSLQSMISQVNTLILAGYETMAVALTFTTLLLGRHSDVQETVFLELQAIFADSMERTITADDLERMRYLEMVIKETLRLYPSVQTIGSSLCEPLELPNGAILPAGSTVLINLDSYHRDPQYFPAPDVFLPERFAPDAQTPIHPYAYLPFSSGPRNCIGQRFAMLELKLVLASIFRKYRVTSRTEPESVIRAVSPFLKPLTDIGVMLEKREN